MYLDVCFFQQVGCFIMGLSIMAIPLAKQGHIVVYLLCIAIVGAGDGLVYLLIGPIVRHLMELEDVSQALGFMMCLIALPLTVGPTLAGILCGKEINDPCHI